MSGESSRLTQASSLVSENRFEDTQQRFRELVVKIVFGIDRDIVFKNVERIFRLFVCSGTFRHEKVSYEARGDHSMSSRLALDPFDDDICHSVAQSRCGS